MPPTGIDMQRVKVIDGPLPPGVFQAADMEPRLVTAPQHLAVLQELIAREPLFHRAEFGTTRRDFERMTAPEFWEVGASGRRYSRQFCLDTLQKRYEHPTEDVWEVGEFHCLQIAADNYLLTYKLAQGERGDPRRATITGDLPPRDGKLSTTRARSVEASPAPS